LCAHIQFDPLTLSSSATQNAIFSFFVWCLWIQIRKLTSHVQRSKNFKELLMVAIPLLDDELTRLKSQWRLQILVYMTLDIILLLLFSIELQFIVFNRRECNCPIGPLLLFMFNTFVHLFSFLFGIAILNDSISQIESVAWKCSGWKIASHLRTPEQTIAVKDPEYGLLLLGLSCKKLHFKFGFLTIDWAFIWTVTSLVATIYGLTIPLLGSLGNDRVCT
jgi:hypothetical protein